jgi:hypothetical protein
VLRSRGGVLVSALADDANTERTDDGTTVTWSGGSSRA